MSSAFSSLMGLVSFLFLILCVVGFHEFGHFITARALGIGVTKFSIGFGKTIFSYRSKKSGIEYAISAIPLGGYVRMIDEDACTKEQMNSSYERAPAWKKFLVVFNGPLFNLILAFILYFILAFGGNGYIKPYVYHVSEGSVAEQVGIEVGDLFTHINGKPTESSSDAFLYLTGSTGKEIEVRLTRESGESYVVRLDLHKYGIDRHHPNVLENIGVTLVLADFTPIIGSFSEGNNAEAAGLKVGDKIISINGNKIELFGDIPTHLETPGGQEIQMSYERDGVVSEASFSLINDDGRMIVGIYPEFKTNKDWVGNREGGVVNNTEYALHKILVTTETTFKVLKGLFVGDVSAGNLSGPISVADSSAQAAKAGWKTYLFLMAFFSVNIMLMNLLPIPGLDGAHLVSITYKGITGHQPGEVFSGIMARAGFIFILSIMAFTLLSDLSRYIFGI